MPEKELNLTSDEPVDSANAPPPVSVTPPFSLDQNREETRGDLARGLLWLLTFAIGGILAFVGLGRLEGTVITQSIFPSLVALAGTALGFYFGSQTKPDSSGSNTNAPLLAFPPNNPSPPSNSAAINQSADQAAGAKKDKNGIPPVAAAPVVPAPVAPSRVDKDEDEDNQQNGDNDQRHAENGGKG